MKIVPEKKLLTVKKLANQELSVDMSIISDEDGKNLITCEVISGTTDHPSGMIVVTGVYSLYKLIYKGDEYYFLDEEDIIGHIEE